jgi:hypothetical protein
MSFKIDIEDYLSEEEIKEACKTAVKDHAKKLLGVNESAICTRIARQLVKDEHQAYVKKHEDLLSEKIIESINKITLGSLFFTAFGWANEGHKLLSGLLIKHKDLLEKKLIQTIE